MRPASNLARFVVLILVSMFIAGCGGGPSGTYEAKDPTSGATMTLNFQKGNKVNVSMANGPMKVAVDCDYSVEGDRVTIKPPDSAGPLSESIVLVKKGNGYEGKFAGDTLMFTKK